MFPSNIFATHFADDTAPFMQKILKAHVRILLYYGDTDMACNFMLGQQFCSKLGLKAIQLGFLWRNKLNIETMNLTLETLEMFK
jgi:hypothetical protein